MEQDLSWGERALAGVERLRQKDFDVRGRVSALLLELRGAYYTDERKWRVMAEEDLRALWRSGVHDHIGGGFFSASGDREWLRPSFEKRLDDNAVLAFLYTEAWESGHMPFYRDAAEEALDFCLRDLALPGGLYAAGLRASDPAAAKGNPFLFTPAEICEILGEEDGRHFAECYDITSEDNCPGGSIPNLLLNERWHLLPPGYDDFRERLRLTRAACAGLVRDTRAFVSWNALLLSALAKAGRVFSDRRYLAAAASLADRLSEAERSDSAACAAFAFAQTELYDADFDPAHLTAAAAAAERLGDPAHLCKKSVSEAQDRTLSLAALGFDALWRLTDGDKWHERRGAILRELIRNPERHGPESLGALCVLLSAGHTERKLLCVTPSAEAPETLKAVRARYAPDLRVLVKTPQNAAALSVVSPWTAEFTAAERPVFYSCADGVWSGPVGL